MNAAAFTVERAAVDQLDAVARLFDGYRQFYRQAADLAAARRFLSERFAAGDSVILVAILGERVVGFTQLYPSFSSVSVGRTWILNDLFVEESARGRGIGRALMRAARDFAEADGALRLELATERTNAAGQALYETEGYVRDDSFLHYSLPLR